MQHRAKRRAPTPDHRTVLLSVGLGCAALALLRLRPDTSTLIPLNASPLAVALALTAAFALAERATVHVEIRKRAHSFTLAGVPFALGVLLLPPHLLVIARVVGSLATFALQRTTPVKVVYKLSAYALEAALVAFGIRVVLRDDVRLTVGAAAQFAGVLTAGNFVMTVLVLASVQIHNGSAALRETAAVIAQAAAMTVVSATVAIALVMLVSNGSLGTALALVVIAGVFSVYRAYVAMGRRHKSLALVHEFVTGRNGSESVEAVGEHLLARVRRLLRATEAQLVIFDGASAGSPSKAMTMAVSADDVLRVENGMPERDDWLMRRVVVQQESIVVQRTTKDLGMRRWLADHGYRDALVVPLVESGRVTGVLTVADRLGDTTTFVDDDRALLQTLSGHLAAAIGTARLVERLGYEATHDMLTGLANRSLLTQRIREARARGPVSAVLLLDLDSFKEVNDALGHHVGDQLLVVVAERLRACLPAGATIARLGGDEFAILLTDLGDAAEAGEAARAHADAITRALAVPAHFDEAALTPDASIGIALGASGDESGDLLRQADTAMYEAKTSGASIAVHRPELDRGRAERLALLADLRFALESAPDQLVLYYQPKVDLATGDLVGVEALARWQHPTRGFVGPESFIPLAETTALIERLTPLVIDGALADCHTWLAAGHDVSVAINISARNLENRFLPSLVRAALERRDVPASKVVLEITESSVMGDPAQTEPVLRELADLGLCLSLDDFGTGYSSLSYLQRLPVREVKIDRSFVQGLIGDAPDSSAALIRSITGLSANLGLRVVAEGVEQQHLMPVLTELGCHLVQGFHISPPLPCDRFIVWAEQYASTRHVGLRLIGNDGGGTGGVGTRAAG